MKSSGPWPDWRDDAACLDEDPELFFPIGTGARAHAQEAEAKAVCAVCPAMSPCAAFASDHGYDGVWGGQNEAERRAGRAQRRVRHAYARRSRSTDENEARRPA